MKNVFVFFMFLLLLKNSYGQDSINVNHDNLNSVRQSSEKTSSHPYKTSFKKDAPVIIVGLGLTYLGNTLIKNKKPLTVAELADKTKDKVPFFDRGNAGFYSDKINKDSYIPFLGSLPLPILAMILNKNERNNASYILVMYVESLSITSALFTMAAGTIHRPRPLVYGTIAPTDQRINKNNQRSFFAGHTASTASATFFCSKSFSGS